MLSEWTYEGGTKANRQVAADGNRTRYQFGLHNEVEEMSGRHSRQLGWYRRITSLVPYFYGIRLFYLPREESQ